MKKPVNEFTGHMSVKQAAEEIWPSAQNKVDKGLQSQEAHEHTWELQSTQFQYVATPSTTGIAREYAYLLCKKCSIVKKVEVLNG